MYVSTHPYRSLRLSEGIFIGDLFCNNKVGVHVGGVLKHDVLCDTLQGLNYQGAI